MVGSGIAGLQAALTAASEAEVLLIDIEYQVRATNNVFNLVYPFYLEQGAA